MSIKHFVIISFCLSLFLACNKNDFAPKEVENDSHRISLQVALDHLDSFLDAMDNNTKTEATRKNYSLDNIETVSYTVNTSTKGSLDDSKSEDNLMYLVNFDNDLGAAVLAADDRLGDVVLCVTESGSLHKESFDHALDLIDKGTTKATEEIESLSNSSCDVVPLLLTSAILNSVNNYGTGIIDNSSQASTKALSSAVKYGPFVYTKWDQAYVGVNPDTLSVFNKFTPNHYPAGCVVIAVAQIMLSTLHPFSLTADSYYCNSSDMLTVAHYTSPSYPGTTSAQIQVGKFVHHLGASSLLCGVHYAADGTSGDADGAKRALEAFMYNNVVKRTGFGSSNQAIATENIRQGRPVYLSGKPEGVIFNGHAWVLDGEWGNYYHVNWGMRGAHDGYFTKNVFHMTNRPEYDSVIDANTYDRYSGTPHYYVWWFRMVTYTL